MPSSWAVSNGGYLAQLSIEYCYVATISGFSGLEAVGPPAAHNPQKVGKTKLRNVGTSTHESEGAGARTQAVATAVYKIQGRATTPILSYHFRLGSCGLTSNGVA